MKRIGMLAAAAVAGLVLAGCGASTDAVEVNATGAEAQVLAALGFEAAEFAAQTAAPVAASAPASGSVSVSASVSASAKPGGRSRSDRRKARVLLRKNTLHGEAVVETDDGTKTVVFQRGAVTSVDATTGITVKSTDGYTMTWRLGADLRVVERRTTLQPDQVKVGVEVGVAGVKEGTASAARLIVVKR